MFARTPQEIDACFAEAVNGGDLEEIVAFYEPHAVLVAEPGKEVRGHDGIRRAMAAYLMLKPRLSAQTVSVVEGPHVALVRTRWSLRGTDPSGAPIQMSGHAQEVVRRQADGTWRFAIDDPFAG
jgi:uncharacterized protein (TIGR02246 family)